MEERIEIDLTITVTVMFEAIKEERMTRHYPGCPAHIEINEVLIPDSDSIIAEFEDEIEQACWDYVNECAAEDAMMQAEYRRDAREDR